MLSPSSRHHAVFKVAAFINFWAKVMLFSCLQAYMTALNSLEKLKIDIIIYFRMFSFSNDLKKYKKSHSAILIFGQLWLDSGPLCDGWQIWRMRTWMKIIGISTVLESSVVQIESSLFSCGIQIYSMWLNEVQGHLVWKCLTYGTTQPVCSVLILRYCFFTNRNFS